MFKTNLCASLESGRKSDPTGPRGLAAVAILLLSLLAGTSPAGAGPNAEGLRDFCLQDPGNPSTMSAGPVAIAKAGAALHRCIGYLSGALDVAEVWLASLENRGVCLPQRVSEDQSRRLFLTHVERNPQDLHRNAAEVFIYALRGAFPCQR